MQASSRRCLQEGRRSTLHVRERISSFRFIWQREAGTLRLRERLLPLQVADSMKRLIMGESKFKCDVVWFCEPRPALIGQSPKGLSGDVFIASELLKNSSLLVSCRRLMLLCFVHSGYFVGGLIHDYATPVVPPLGTTSRATAPPLLIGSPYSTSICFVPS